MDKLIVAALSIIGGVLIASGLVAHLTFIEGIGIPLYKQPFVGGTLLVIALVIHVAMGGRLFPSRR
ncbi:hypothetical protein AWB69_09080 [Caballeronia udeis]|uniref:Uncharacterized protein n=1 Tax=Caballeronia udeis TaxID=1232866 RepID=A0A158JY66_9BURK|nr:hypothetical protein [Caballeronia udeis]SAL73812.1 hypothetical protein AWB69_09080 [Caballeronia udeis]